MFFECEAAPTGVPLVRSNRKYKMCERCGFLGDTIYFNRTEDGETKSVCGFCEIKPNIWIYNELRDPQFLRATMPASRQGCGELISCGIVHRSRDIDAPPALAELIDSRAVTATISVFTGGAYVISFYRIRFFDDQE